jgi:hypothetical protein
MSDGEKRYRDSRLYQNSDKKPKRNQVVFNMGCRYVVKSVSKCGYFLKVKGESNKYLLNTGCSFLAEEPRVNIGYTMPNWLKKRLDFEKAHPEFVK